METNFNFKSQVCTDKVQSERLLALGLKKETADMCWTKMARISGTFYVPELAPINMVSWRHTPAWSLHRLLSLIEYDDGFIDVSLREGRYGIHYGYDDGWYDNLYDAVISCIEALIEEKDFNKEYLV